MRLKRGIHPVEIVSHNGGNIMIAILDRFEGLYAVLEIEGQMKNIERKLIPEQAREGDVLVYRDKNWIIDTTAASKRREQINKLADELWED